MSKGTRCALPLPSRFKVSISCSPYRSSIDKHLRFSRLRVLKANATPAQLFRWLTKHCKGPSFIWKWKDLCTKQNIACALLRPTVTKSKHICWCNLIAVLIAQPWRGIKILSVYKKRMKPHLTVLCPNTLAPSPAELELGNLNSKISQWNQLLTIQSCACLTGWAISMTLNKNHV